MNEKSLKLSDVRWIGMHFLDANSHTFLYEKQYYKAILPGAPLHNSERFGIILSKIADRGFIPNTVKTHLKIEKYTDVYHQQSDFFSVPLEKASFESVKQAALLIIKFFLYLKRHNLTLLDAHSKNIVFQNGNVPLWCDIGSIVPYDQGVFRSAFEQFVRYIIYPILLRNHSQHLEPVARSGLERGISHELFHTIINSSDFFKIIAKETLNIDIMLNEISTYIENLQFPYADTAWGGYYDCVSDDIAPDKKPTPGEDNRETVISSILRGIRPKYIVDLGANAGRYSRLAAKLGAREVLSIEPDIVAMAKNYLGLQREKLPIKLLQEGISLTPFDQPGDTAIALALTHHLFYTENMPFRLIATCLASYTTQHLVTEFMPHGMSGKDKPDSLPQGYSLEIFTKQLERHFAKVEAIEYPFPADSSPRVLLLCSQKRATPLDDGLGNLNRPPA